MLCHAVQVVLCSNHGGEPPQGYERPPAPDSNKLELAQQQGLAMGLPPVKAKGTFSHLAHFCLALLQCTLDSVRRAGVTSPCLRSHSASSPL